MSKRVGILILHGIGVEKQGYAQSFIEGIKSKLTPEEADKVIFSEVLYADIFDKYQSKRKDYLESSSQKFQLLTRFLRKLLILILSDATSYKDKAAYREVQQRLSRSIANLTEQLPEKKIIIVAAHSLGAMVISDYIYDEQKMKEENSILELAEIGEVRAMVTFGCNIPLFEMGHKKTICIKAPSREFIWRNFFSPFDVLGYKLANYYDEKPSPLVDLQDNEIVLGDLLRSWNIFSHLAYWDSPSLHTEMSKIIRKNIF